MRDPVLAFVLIVAFQAHPEVSFYVFNALNALTLTVCGLPIGFNPHPAAITLHVQCVQQLPLISKNVLRWGK